MSAAPIAMPWPQPGSASPREALWSQSVFTLEGTGVRAAGRGSTGEASHARHTVGLPRPLRVATVFEKRAAVDRAALDANAVTTTERVRHG